VLPVYRLLKVGEGLPVCVHFFSAGGFRAAVGQLLRGVFPCTKP
jgi:hypothetical protein